jgi:hypothetical protein
MSATVVWTPRLAADDVDRINRLRWKKTRASSSNDQTSRVKRNAQFQSLLAQLARPFHCAAKIAFGIMPWMPLVPSTTWVTW